jgi:hypothetical protein
MKMEIIQKNKQFYGCDFGDAVRVGKYKFWCKISATSSSDVEFWGDNNSLEFIELIQPWVNVFKYKEIIRHSIFLKQAWRKLRIIG